MKAIINQPILPKVADFVAYKGSDFSFQGHIVSIVRKMYDGTYRIVVENNLGLFCIFKIEELVRITEDYKQAETRIDRYDETP